MNDTERLLIAFAARVIDQARGNGYPGDIDGGWLQDTMTDMGVLEAVAVTEPCDETNCSCAECDGIPGNCYRLPAAVQLTLAEAEKPIPPHSACSSEQPSRHIVTDTPLTNYAMEDGNGADKIDLVTAARTMERLLRRVVVGWRASGSAEVWDSVALNEAARLLDPFHTPHREDSGRKA